MRTWADRADQVGGPSGTR